MSTNNYSSQNIQDMPPTHADVTMRASHTKDSVAYNLKHLKDHGQALVQSLSKLNTVQPDQAKVLAMQAAAQVGNMHNTINKFHGKGDMMKPKTTKKTGKTDGKSNALGGGGRFQQMKNMGMSGGLAAYIGRKKFSAGAMAKMAAAGKKSK